MAGGSAGGPLMLPVVVPFGRWPVAPTVTVSTLLDDPDRPGVTRWGSSGRCRDCHRRCRNLRDGRGPKCWARLNGQRRRTGGLARTPVPRPADQDGPDLIDLLTERTELIHAQ